MCPPVEVHPIVRPLGKLQALGDLLNCVDVDRWASLARPSAQGLAGLVFSVHEEISDAVAAQLEAALSR